MSCPQREGRLIRGVGGLYTVRCPEGAEYTLRARGRFRIDGMTPLVGDRVLFTPGSGDQHGWLDEILPRTSQCLRPPAANISLLVIVVAPTPEPDLLLADRLLIHAARSGFSAVIAANKCDLQRGFSDAIGREYAASGAEVFGVSAVTGEGIDGLSARMRGELCCMAGQSAAGKSTLLSALCGLTLKTGELSRKIQRGRHTTRHVELLEARGLSVLDTPGFSLLSLEEGIAPEQLEAYYPEFSGLSAHCRFQPCRHDREPGCAVSAAVQGGSLDKNRHERYRTLLSEAKEAWKARYK